MIGVHGQAEVHNPEHHRQQNEQRQSEFNELAAVLVGQLGEHIQKRYIRLYEIHLYHPTPFHKHQFPPLRILAELDRFRFEGMPGHGNSGL